MSRESYFALGLGLAAIIVAVLQMMYPQIPPYIGWPIVALLSVGVIILVRRGIRREHSKASETKTKGDKTEKKPRIFRSLLMTNSQYTHKCSQCGWGFVIGKYDTGVVCPKCGNADDIIPRL